jgi:membrane-associated protease RseP (regulator of RpoE activity)
MTRTSTFSLRHIFAALAVAVTFSTPALADCWRAGHGMPADHPACCKYRHNMQGGDACPYMEGKMQRYAKPAEMRGKSLGVMVSNLPNAMLDEAGLSHGINVEKVLPDSAAAVAGIQAGDLITEFAGSPVYSADRLRWLVRKAEPGKGLEIKLMREQKPVVVNATLIGPAAKPNCEMRPGPKPEMQPEMKPETRT